jgi:hypothetical protein
MVRWREIVSGTRRVIRQKIVEIEVTDPANQIPDLIHWGSKGEDLRLVLPSTMHRMMGAFGFHGGWNPMTLALRVDVEAFKDFFKFFQPKDLSEMYFLGKQFGPISLSPENIPWIFKYRQKPSRRENKLSTNYYPSKLFGPSTSCNIDNEFKRMQLLVQSIQKQGYRPDKYGDIVGYFMQLDGEYRFFIHSGKHRAAALAFLGFESIPVRMRPLYPRVIDGDRAGDWPLVRSGQMSEDFALAVMRRFFEFDGTQQRDRIFGLSS